MIYLQDADFTLHQGDALEVLRTLPDESVHMCVTSPPFYGLRDYGTGTWQGGDVECDHKMPPGPKPGGGRRDAGRYQEGAFNGPVNAGLEDKHYRDTCGKCGATRIDQQIGLEETPEQWVQKLVEVFSEVRRVLRKDGTLWLEVGDSYGSSNTGGSGAPEGLDPAHTPNAWASHRQSSQQGTAQRHPYKPKDLIGAPWLLAFALRADGWYLRSDIVWSRPNPMPESVTDRPTKSHSYVFLLSKSPRYFFDQEAVREPHSRLWDSTNGGSLRGGSDYTDTAGVRRSGGKSAEGERRQDKYPDPNPAGRNIRSVWTIATQPYPEAHFATYPEELVRRCILAGTSERGCCPECGAPWVREVERLPVERTSDRRAAFAENQGRRDGFTGSPPSNQIQGRRETGWHAFCDCEAGPLQQVTYNERFPHMPIPCTVLDPFSGSGTTALVARKQGRKCIGIELSADYCELSARRLQQLSLLSEAGA